MTNRDATDPTNASQCERCGYTPGLAVDRCPECGSVFVPMGADSRSPWKIGTRLRFGRGLARIVLRPSSLAMADRPAATSWWNTWLFAAITYALACLVWPYFKTFMGGLSLLTWAEPRWTWSSVWDLHARQLVPSVNTWKFSPPWLVCGTLFLQSSLWALTVVALSRRRNVARPTIARATMRVLLFTPWVFILQAGYLISVKVTDPRVVPEISTLFGGSPFRSFWLIRGVVPVMVVGTVYLRHALGIRYRFALPASLLLLPCSNLCFLAANKVWRYAIRPLL